ncbi:NADPH oxidase 5 isoform X1, partial [Paramuricea clavata]
FTRNLFDLLDSDEDGEIDISDLMSSLDRLECASTDTKWYLWIEERFNISMTDDRKITFEHFKNALHLDKTFFAERFFTLFDDNGDGKIDMKELITGLELLTNGTQADKITFLFRVYDLDGNGYLSGDEMRTVLKSCMEESKLKLGDQQLDELMDVFFEEMETNNKGEIGLDQFKAFLSEYPGVAENLSISAAHLLKPPVTRSKTMSSYIPRRLRWEYIKKNPIKVFFVTLYVLLNAALCIWVGIERRHQGGWIILARINGMCLNFNSMFILVLMMKGLLTWVRSTRFGKFFPIDQHIIFHKCVAGVILFQSVLHFIGHLGRYITTDPPSGKPKFEVWEYMFTTRTPEGWVNGSAGITGVLLLIILVVMSILSQPSVRKRGFFELFYYTHHLYIVWWVLLILHAPNFWKWFIGPAVLYFAERILRLRIVNRARYGKTIIEEGITLPSKVTHLVIKRPPNFQYKPGDYVIINIPQIAKYEWHPFTISSSPDLTGYVWLHIRGVGTWTKKLYDFYEEKEEEECKRKSVKRATIRQRKARSIKDKERQTQRSIRQRYASSVKRHRLGVIVEEEDEEPQEDINTNEAVDALSEVVIENKPTVAKERKKAALGKSVNVEMQSPEEYGRLRSLDRNAANKLEIYIDGPYGAPATHFTEAEHAVLISSGIGVTPFASILQTIMLRYKNASHSCPNCDYCWVGDVPYSLRKLQKVDFFWINRDQHSFEWFLSLLNQLEVEQSESEGVFNDHFLDMHIYMTSALRKEDMKALGLQLALELIHSKKEKDLITGLKTRTNPGRPDWDKVFSELQQQNHGKISVFYCGNPALGNTLKAYCQKFGFGFRQENF